jgi:hypothetical protein
MALCSLISETVLEAVRTEEKVPELPREIAINNHPAIILYNDIDEEIKKVNIEDEHGDKVTAKASPETLVSGKSVVEQEAGGIISQGVDRALQSSATDIEGVNDEMQNEVLAENLSSVEKKGKISDDPLRLILNLAVTEIIKNNPKKMSDAFSDHIEGIAPVEKDGTVSKEPETPVILRLPNNVLEFADSIESSDEPISSIDQEHKDNVSLKVMDYLGSSEEGMNIGQIDSSFLEEVTKNVRFQVPEKPDSIFHDPRTQQRSSGQVDHLTEIESTNGEFGYTEAKDTEFGYTEGKQEVYGYDTSASERD